MYCLIRKTKKISKPTFIFEEIRISSSITRLAELFVTIHNNYMVSACYYTL